MIPLTMCEVEKRYYSIQDSYKEDGSRKRRCAFPGIEDTFMLKLPNLQLYFRSSCTVAALMSSLERKMMTSQPSVIADPGPEDASAFEEHLNMLPRTQTGPTMQAYCLTTKRYLAQARLRHILRPHRSRWGSLDESHALRGRCSCFEIAL